MAGGNGMLNTGRQRLSRKTLSDQLAEALMGAVVSGEIAPGEQLPTEQELCNRFGVSRTVIREAVRSLVSKGLVEVRRGRGMWVTMPSNWDPLDTAVAHAGFLRDEFGERWWQLIEARKIFEVEIAGLSAERRTDAELAALEQVLDRMRQSAHVGDLEEYRIADAKFHGLIIRASHNPVIQRILDPLIPLLLAGGQRPPSRVERALEYHESLFAAISRGDQEAAREAMKRVFPEESGLSA
jgi:GntR family transcriptional regulator, transcriptional repressor for pyruvate dehydrogenase complex